VNHRGNPLARTSESRRQEQLFDSSTAFYLVGNEIAADDAGPSNRRYE